MSRSLKINPKYLEKVKSSLVHSGFPNQQYLAMQTGMSRSTVNKFLNGKAIDYLNFIELCEQLELDWQNLVDLKEKVDSNSSFTEEKQEKISKNWRDWDLAPDISNFYGRQTELANLEQWILKDKCRLVAILGMAGIGKTALAVKLTKKIQDEFEYVIWRSLREAPPLEKLLADLLQFLIQKQSTNFPNTLVNSVSLLIKILNQHRCLLILDGWDSVLEKNQLAGYPRQGFEDYGELFRKVGESYHKSCLIITSREAPKELDLLTGKEIKTYSLKLEKLNVEAAMNILAEEEISGDKESFIKINDLYKGNPLFLKLSIPVIKTIFNNNTEAFLQYSKEKIDVIMSIKEALNKQISHLSDLEKEIIYWLAIEQKPVTIIKLKEILWDTTSSSDLVDAFMSLNNRFLIEKTNQDNQSQWKLHQLIAEYISDRFIDQIYHDINEFIKNKKLENMGLLKTHSILDKEHIVNQIKTRLYLHFFDKNNVKNTVNNLLSLFDNKSIQAIGYGKKNILYLLEFL